jgi:hypothetical protein
VIEFNTPRLTTSVRARGQRGARPRGNHHHDGFFAEGREAVHAISPVGREAVHAHGQGGGEKSRWLPVDAALPRTAKEMKDKVESGFEPKMGAAYGSSHRSAGPSSYPFAVTLALTRHHCFSSYTVLGVLSVWMVNGVLQLAIKVRVVDEFNEARET